MELFIISKRSKSRTCQAWQVFVSDSLRRKKNSWLLSQIPSIISKSPARKTLQIIQVFPSAQQECGAKGEEPSPAIRNMDKHQEWFYPAPCRGNGSTGTWKSITIPWLTPHPYSGFAEHQKSKEIRSSSNAPAGGSEKVWL